MRILIIRHAEPDYNTDTLTEKGKREAALLAERLSCIPISSFYVSTLGRAKETASMTLQKFGLSLPSERSCAAQTSLNSEIRSADQPSDPDSHSMIRECDWLREFPHLIERPDRPGEISIPWDWLPQDWTAEEAYFNRNAWHQTEVMQKGQVWETYRTVTDSLDAVLSDHGYVRNGDIYQACRPNREILAFFCHFGLECVLLSHLINVSPMILWHHACALTSSVTSLYTEERRNGIAVFRMNAFGDTSHLYAGKEEPSFAARFCETYDRAEERHD